VCSSDLADDAEAQLGLAYVALRHHDAKAAADALHGARALNQTAGWRYADSARMLLEQDIDGALAALRQATLQPDPVQPAPWLLLSDLAAYEGDTEAALAHIEQGLRQFPEHPRLYAQQARLLLWADRAGEAATAAERGIAADLSSHDAWLARADIARREGDAATALSAYDLAISLKPDDARAWYGRGAAMGERDYLRQARDDLAQALALDPAGIGYQGELGGLETQADAYDAAETAYRAALAANPADFVALTGLGVLDLKRGRPQQALESLLKAGVMEPRYARVHVHTATAYYQMGQFKQAEQELARAGELDDKDPLPHFMAAMIASDQFRPAAAIDSARQAMQRLPYLKSLNQLANDQQGSANLGQAFAFMGMEEWARGYAQDSYNPFWAGSHLFLADRYNGLFTKNSELFQGLISDPVVFGAGNRFKSLLRAPATHLDLSLRYSRSDSLDGFSPQLAYSGYRAAPKPMAWYLGYENVNWDLLDRPYDLNVFTAGLGIKPRFDQGLFVFADASRQDSQPVGSLPGFGDYDVDDRLDTRRLDIGFNHQFSPVSQLWLKAGYFDSDASTDGTLGSDPLTSKVEVDLPEFAWRHSFATLDGHQISWGGDFARRDTEGRLRTDLFAAFGLPDFWIEHDDSDLRERSLDLYVSDVYQISPRMSVQADLAYQRHDRRADNVLTSYISDIPGTPDPSSEDKDIRQLSPRLGLVYSPEPQTRIRFAWQNWIRPSGMSSLGPVATAGIPLDDRLVSRGGELNRARLQGEREIAPSTFVSGYLDYKDIDNRRFTIRPFAVSELESLGKLRPRDYGQLMRDDQYEFVDTPDYAGGVIRSAGFAVNRLLTPEWAAIARYVLTDSRNAMDSSLMVPYLPRHTLAVGATWINPNGWYLAGLLTHRSHRYADEANTASLGAGISGDLDVFRESRDKRWLLRFSANDLFDRNQDSQYTAELNYRF
jgi:tetratricopeptide (TPR) repeat protein